MAIDLKEFFVHALREQEVVPGIGPTFSVPGVKTDPAAAAAVGMSDAGPAMAAAKESASSLTFFKNQVPGIVQAKPEIAALGFDPSGLDSFAAALDGVVFNLYQASQDPIKFKADWQNIAGKWGVAMSKVLDEVAKLKGSAAV
jgi:hypothetical protein